MIVSSTRYCISVQCGLSDLLNAAGCNVDVIMKNGNQFDLARHSLSNNPYTVKNMIVTDGLDENEILNQIKEKYNLK